MTMGINLVYLVGYLIDEILDAFGISSKIVLSKGYVRVDGIGMCGARVEKERLEK